MGWLITLAVVTGIFLIPIGASLLYENEKFILRIRVAMLKFTLNLNKSRDKKPEKTTKMSKSDLDPEPNPSDSSLENTLEQQKGTLRQALAEKKQAKLEAKEALRRAEEAEKKTEQPKKPQEAPQPPSKPGIRIYFPFIRLALDLLSSLRRKLRIEKLYLQLILAGNDPCDLAVNYGRVWAAATTLLGHINQAFVVKDQNLDIQCDFTAEKMKASARLDLTITIGRLLSLAVLYGARAFKEFLIFKKRKGGAAI